MPDIPLRARHIIGIVGIAAVTALVIDGSLSSEAGLAVIIGVLASLGAYTRVRG